MDKFRIDIYRQFRDKDFNPTEFKLVFHGTFETSIIIEEVVDKLHEGEGIAIDLIKPQDEIPLIRLEFLGGQEEKGTVDWLNENFQFVSDDKEDFKSLVEDDTVLSLGEIELNVKDTRELLSFLNSEFPDDFTAITKKIGIYEWGASGYFVDFIISLSAGLSQSGIAKIFQFLKGKGYEYAEIKQFDIGRIKDFISKKYGVNPNMLKLTSTRTYENNQTRFTFSSRYADYMVEIDNKNKVIKSEVRQLSQTNI
ncbi:MAG: hypothetical protein PVF73_12830 [Bacteroidales bacterium]|jgi:hypothetical protein